MPAATIEQLSLLGISGICNVVSAIKTAKFFEMNEHDVLFAPMTDSLELYGSRLEEQTAEHGKYTELDAVRHYGRYIEGIGADNMRELTYADRKQLHNFKYFTWVEQQGRARRRAAPTLGPRLLDRNVRPSRPTATNKSTNSTRPSPRKFFHAITRSHAALTNVGLAGHARLLNPNYLNL